MTERTDIGYITIENRDEFEELWQKTVSWSSNEVQVSASGSATSSSSTTPALGQGDPMKALKNEETQEPEQCDKDKNTGNDDGDTPKKPAKKAKAKGKSAGVKKDSLKTTVTPTKGDTVSIKALTGNAIRVKKNYHEIVSTAGSLRDTVSTHGDWGWANNEAMLGALKSSLDSLTSAAQADHFVQRFMSSATDYVKNAVEESEFTLGLQRLPALEAKIEAVTRELNKLNDLHRVHMNYKGSM